MTTSTESSSQDIDRDRPPQHGGRPANLVAGLALLFIGVVHIVYGEVAQISGLLAITQAPIIIGSTRVMILQGGIILIAMALLQIADSRRGGVLTGVAATFPLGLIVVNFAAFLLVALSGSPALLADAIPQVVYFLILIVLQAIALSKKLRARYIN